MGQGIVAERFTEPLGPRWKQILAGGGRLDAAGGVLRLALPAASGRAYCDAQFDDCTGVPLARLPWRPPLRMTVRARASHPAHPAHPAHSAHPASPDDKPDTGSGPESQRYLRGTAGFGFWNVMLTMAGGPPRLPDAVWFFAAAPPSNMALVPGVQGWGWKAQVIHAHRAEALLLGVPALASVVRARLTGDDTAAARWVQRVAGAREALLDGDLREWHEYALEWHRDVARFRVDGEDVLVVADPPSGPLGFVAWIDNQYAIVTPRGALRFGVVGGQAEWLELASLRIEPLA